MIHKNNATTHGQLLRVKHLVKVRNVVIGAQIIHIRKYKFFSLFIYFTYLINMGGQENLSSGKSIMLDQHNAYIRAPTNEDLDFMDQLPFHSPNKDGPTRNHLDACLLTSS